MKNEKTAPTLRSVEVPRLVVELPDGKEIHHPLSGETITIGRDPSNRIAIPDNFVSKFHAKLIVHPTSIVLVDLESANKTYVNDRPISEAPVRYGDRIRFGAVKCRLEAPESQAKPEVSPPVSPEPPKASPLPKASPPPKPPVKRAPKPTPPPAAKRSPAPGGSAPPRVEADPMQKLLRVGGLLILVSLALAVLLRVLLVPSENESETSGESRIEIESSAPADAAAPVTPVVTSTTAPPAAAGGGDAEYYFDEGLAHLDTGRLREARASFERALELDPDHSRARTRLSLLEEEIEKKAERHFDNARQAFQFLRYEEAMAEWEMFLLLADESDPRYAEAQQGIQQAQAKLR